MLKYKIVLALFVLGALLFLLGLFPTQTSYTGYWIQNVLSILTGGILMIIGLVYGAKLND